MRHILNRCYAVWPSLGAASLVAASVVRIHAPPGISKTARRTVPHVRPALKRAAFRRQVERVKFLLHAPYAFRPTGVAARNGCRQHNEGNLPALNRQDRAMPKKTGRDKARPAVVADKLSVQERVTPKGCL